MAYTDNIIPAMTSATAPSGVASASSTYGDGVANAAWKAFNHAVAVQADSWFSASTTGWLQYQFPTAHVVICYAIDAGYSGPTYAPKSWTLKGSNDGAAWTTLDTQTAITDWAAPRKVLSIANSTAYAYYRLDITASNSATLCAVGELEMMGVTLRFPVIGSPIVKGVMV